MTTIPATRRFLRDWRGVVTRRLADGDSLLAYDGQEFESLDHLVLDLSIPGVELQALRILASQYGLPATTGMIFSRCPQEAGWWLQGDDDDDGEAQYIYFSNPAILDDDEAREWIVSGINTEVICVPIPDLTNISDRLKALRRCWLTTFAPERMETVDKDWVKSVIRTFLDKTIMERSRLLIEAELCDLQQLLETEDPELTEFINDTHDLISLAAVMEIEC